jgi:hypothetical protein
MLTLVSVDNLIIVVTMPPVITTAVTVSAVVAGAIVEP